MIGRDILIRSIPFKVIGVMESKGQFLGFDMDDAIYVPGIYHQLTAKRTLTSEFVGFIKVDDEAAMKAAGIDMLPASIGIPFVRKEIEGARGSREVLVAGQLGVMMDEFDATGGIDTESIDGASASLMVGDVTSFGLHSGITVMTTLDPQEQGFLFDHQIDGTPVLPGVMGMELPSVGNVDISDGYLDLFAITKSMKPVRAVSQHLFSHEGTDTGVYHWRGKEISIEADPVQDVWIDGEMGGQTPFTVIAMPQALEIVVPD